MSKLSDPTAKFRDPELARFLIQKVNKTAGKLAAKKGRKLLLMEVCGTHTFAISRSGLRDMLSDYLDLRSGPGCPVCVTHQRDIDQMIALASLPDITVATFGDMVRVPGSNGSLEQAQADGAKVEVFYSPADVVEKAARHPERQYVFLGVGFETTAPVIALAIQEAAVKDLRNFSVFSAHKKVVPILRSLLADPDLAIDGFLLPGHVSTILGRQAYDFMTAEHGIPAAIAGFEPVDILTAIMAVLEMLAAGQPAVVNSYQRAVRDEGNPVAQALLARVFQDADAYWRGFDLVPKSGLVLQAEYQAWDATGRFAPAVPAPRASTACRCGDVLKGKIIPRECALFKQACRPANPVGPCMVSSEGACAAYYRYHQ